MQWNKRLIVISLMLFSVCVLAAEETLVFDNEGLRERYLELTEQLRCPKCENQNIAGSNAPISEDMRNKTYELLHLGYSDNEIVDFMVDRYTEFVIYQPRMSLGTVWLWLGPTLALSIGAIFVILLARRSGTRRLDDLSNEERARLDRMLKEDSKPL